MKPVDYSPPRVRPRKWNLVLLAVLLVTLLSMLVLAVSMLQDKPTPAPPARAPQPVATVATVSSAPKVDVNAVLALKVDPVLEQLQKSDDDACEKAEAVIKQHFNAARDGAPRFAKAIIGPLNGIKTTWLAGKGVVQRRYYHDPSINPVGAHVRWNYEQDVTSGDKIRHAIEASMDQLKEDFRANRNKAIHSISRNLKSKDLPANININRDQLDQMCQTAFETAMADVNGNHIAEKAAMGSAASFALSSAATLIAERAIAAAVSEYAVAAGGAAATGAGGGGTIGSMIPGPGTIIGASVGLLAGIGVDAWISHRNKARTVVEVDKSLSYIEEKIMNGSQGHPGVEKSFHAAAAGQQEMLRTKVREKILEASQ